jgi:hypothetical protein
VAAILAFALLMPMLQASAAPISPSPDPTWQTNGRVRTVQYSPDGSVIFMAGEFTSVRPPGSPLGSNEVPRNHAAAFDATTGALLAWDPNLDGNVWALAVSPDGNTVFMGGDFLNVGGLTRNHLAAVDAFTGVPTSWNPRANARVRVILPSPDGTLVYIGGEFGTVNGTAKQLVAAIDTADRNLVPGFTASVTQYNDTCPPRCPPVVASLALSPDGSTLYIGGHFGLIDGQGPFNNAGSVDAQTGSIPGTWNPNVFHQIAQSKNQKNTVYAILPYLDRVYICGDFASVGGEDAHNLASTLASDGSLVPGFAAQDDGGTPACAIGGSLLYMGGHFLEVDGVPRSHIAAVDLTTGALDPWKPSANSARGLHAFATLGSGQSFKLGAGGDFTKIGGVFQQGFAQFTVPFDTPPFTDDFETGTLSKWSSTSGTITVQQTTVNAGQYAAEIAASGSAGAWARKSLTTDQTDLYYRIWFDVLSKPSTNGVDLLRFNNDSNGPIARLLVTAGGALAWRNDANGGVITQLGTQVSQQTWHEAEIHIVVNGTSSTIEVWLDGTQLTSSNSVSLGTIGIGSVQLGDSSSGRTFSVAFDDVAVDTTFQP